MSYEVLKAQRNEIFEIVKNHDLNPTNFSWERTASRFIPNTEISILNHLETAFYYKFDNRRGSHYAIYSPAKDKAQTANNLGSWENQLIHVNIWAESLKKEINAPDLWELAKENKNLVEHDFETEDDSKFSDKESELIKDKLNELSDYIVKTRNLNTEQITFLNNRFSYLEEAVERVTKKDWKIIFIGVLFNIIVGLSLEVGSANEIMIFVNRLFNEIYQKLLN